MRALPLPVRVINARPGPTRKGRQQKRGARRPFLDWLVRFLLLRCRRRSVVAVAVLALLAALALLAELAALRLLATLALLAELSALCLLATLVCRAKLAQGGDGRLDDCVAVSACRDRRHRAEAQREDRDSDCQSLLHVGFSCIH